MNVPLSVSQRKLHSRRHRHLHPNGPSFFSFLLRRDEVLDEEVERGEEGFGEGGFAHPKVVGCQLSRSEDLSCQSENSADTRKKGEMEGG